MDRIEQSLNENLSNAEDYDLVVLGSGEGGRGRAGGIRRRGNSP